METPLLEILAYEPTELGMLCLRRRELLCEPGTAQPRLLGVWSYAESSPFADALRDVFREVRIEPVTVFNNLINEQQTDWLFFARD